MRHLLVNADDFGYSPGVNQGIVEAHEHGIVTSTSVLVDSVAAQDAGLLSRYSGLSVGLHFAITDFSGAAAEFERQLDRFRTITGRAPDHIDTHKLHPTDPGFVRILIDYAVRTHTPVRGYGFAKHISSFFGMDGSDVSVAALIKSLMEASAEYNELMCHVGYADDYLRTHSSYNDAREIELRSICAPEIRGFLDDAGIQLINWRDVPFVQPSVATG